MPIGAWEPVATERLVIATPHTGLVTFEWAVQFKMLQPPVPFNILSNRGLPIDRARDDLVRQAQGIGATHIFFLDSDVVLPPHGLAVLYSKQLPIVCGMYGSKHEAPGVWIETSKSGEARYATVDPKVLEETPLFTHPDIVVGAGCMLIQMEVFHRIKEPWFYWSQGREPGGVSEDFYFCEKIRKHIPIYIDTSVRCGHIDFSQLDWAGRRGRMNL